jgi:glycine hydroxymethyltransferase
MGMSLDAGGHLTHGAKPAMSGKWFNAVQYGVREDDHLIDYDEVEKAQSSTSLSSSSQAAAPIPAYRLRPLPRDCRQGRRLFMVDMAHFAGLVAGGVHPTPAAMPMSSPRPRTRRCAARAAA